MQSSKNTIWSIAVIISALNLFAVPARAQSSAYAKFDARGSTIGLYNLLPDATGCEASRMFSGVVARVAFQPNATGYSCSFTLNTGTVRSSFSLVIDDDEILQPDAEDLVIKSRRLTLRARQCGSGGIWTVEEIRRK